MTDELTEGVIEGEVVDDEPEPTAASSGAQPPAIRPPSTSARNPGERDPWEKRPRESFKAFNAFALFRDLGPTRTLRKVADDLAGGVRNRETVYSQVRDWSSKHDWLERAELYDVMVDHRMIATRMTALQDAERRQANIGQVFQGLALRRVRGEGAEGEEGFIPALNLAALSPGDVARFAEVGVRVERMALGQATDLIGKATNIAPAEFERLMGKVVGWALSNIPEERHDIFLAGLRDIAGGGGRSDSGAQAA